MSEEELVCCDCGDILAEDQAVQRYGQTWCEHCLFYREVEQDNDRKLEDIIYGDAGCS